MAVARDIAPPTVQKPVRETPDTTLYARTYHLASSLESVRQQLVEVEARLGISTPSEAKGKPERPYLDALIEDLRADVEDYAKRLALVAAHVGQPQ